MILYYKKYQKIYIILNQPGLNQIFKKNFQRSRTKDTSVYADYDFPKNCWLGYTFTTQERFNKFYFGDNDYFPEKNKLFISIEPIQEPIQLKFKIDWLIIGAETGNRKGKIVTEKKWIENLIDDCKGENNIPIFLKDNLKSVWGDELIQEFPKKCIQDKK